jgi:glutamine phosphoribosylpyrophosphate amidotransferase
LVATGRTEAEIAREIGADLLIYQDLDAFEDRGRARQARASRNSRRRASTASTSPATSRRITVTSRRRAHRRAGQEDPDMLEAQETVAEGG